jgi:hypothetical protein
MTTRTMHSEPFPDPAEASASRSPANVASTWGSLLRALLAGAVALFVMLLPGQLASRDQAAVLADAASLDGVPVIGARGAGESRDG